MKKVTIKNKEGTKTITLLIADDAFSRLLPPWNNPDNQELLIKQIAEWYMVNRHQGSTIIRSAYHPALNRKELCLLCAEQKSEYKLDSKQPKLKLSQQFDVNKFNGEYAFQVEQEDDMVHGKFFGIDDVDTDTLQKLDKFKTGKTDAERVQVKLTYKDLLAELEKPVNDVFFEQLNKDNLDSKLATQNQFAESENKLIINLQKLIQDELGAKINRLIEAIRADQANAQKAARHEMTSNYERDANKALDQLIRSTLNPLSQNDFVARQKEPIQFAQSKIAEALEKEATSLKSAAATVVSSLKSLVSADAKEAARRKELEAKYKRLSDVYAIIDALKKQVAINHIDEARKKIEVAFGNLQYNRNELAITAGRIHELGLEEKRVSCQELLDEMRVELESWENSKPDPTSNLPPEITAAAAQLSIYAQPTAKEKQELNTAYTGLLVELEDTDKKKNRTSNALQEKPLERYDGFVADREALKEVGAELDRLSTQTPDAFNKIKREHDKRQQQAANTASLIEALIAANERADELLVNPNTTAADFAPLIKPDNPSLAEADSIIAFLNSNEFVEDSPLSPADRKALLSFIHTKTKEYHGKYTQLHQRFNPPAIAAVAEAIGAELPNPPPSPRAQDERSQSPEPLLEPVDAPPKLPWRQRFANKWHSYSLTKKVLIGAAIGLGVLAVLAGVATIIAFTGGAATAPMLTAGAWLLSSGALAPIAAGAGVLFGGIGAGLAYRNHKKHEAAQARTAQASSPNVRYKPLASEPEQEEQRQQLPKQTVKLADLFSGPPAPQPRREETESAVSTQPTSPRLSQQGQFKSPAAASNTVAQPTQPQQPPPTNSPELRKK